MNRNIVEARAILYTTVTLISSKKYAKKVARAAYYLSQQVWE